jgi:hypothetical protein
MEQAFMDDEGSPFKQGGESFPRTEYSLQWVCIQYRAKVINDVLDGLLALDAVEIGDECDKLNDFVFEPDCGLDAATLPQQRKR